jgi:tetratricopeptide (TPR) repeat protein
LRKKQSIEQLIRKGFDLLEIDDFEAAIKVGKQIQAMRHTSAFEILALAHAGLGDTRRALEVLEEGVQRGPTVWLLWQLLGNYRSDLGFYDAAHEAYESALKCPRVNTSSVHLNAGIALSREKRFDEALSRFALVEDDELQPRVQAQRLHILNERRAYEETIRLGEQLLAEMKTVVEAEVRSAIKASVGHAYWFGRTDRERALELAQEALTDDCMSQDALWLIREVDGQVSPTAKHYRLLVEGISQERDEHQNELGFFVTYDVVADSVEEALDYVRRVESNDVRRTLIVDESEEIETRPTQPKGVYARTGRVLFSRES